MNVDQPLVLRAFRDADRSLLQTWLHAAHVAKWYAHPEDWLAEVDQRDGAFAFLHHMIAEYGGVPIGFCQYYEYCKGGETWHGDIDTAGAYSIDYLIGEPAYLGKKLGTRLVAALIDAVRRHADARLLLVQPEPQNRASCGALLSAGFLFDEARQLYRFPLSTGQEPIQNTRRSKQG